MRESMIPDVPLEAVGVWLSHNTGYDMSQLPSRFSLAELQQRIVAANASPVGFVHLLAKKYGENTEISREEWDRTLAVNLTAFFLAAQAVVPPMRARGGGSIIVTASIIARRPRPGLAAYIAAKTGVTGLARALALELAPDRIRVNVINPGPARTPMLARFGLGAGDDAIGEGLPLGRLVEPEDVAAAAEYLASDAAAAVTGTVLNVDAGRDLT